MSKLSREHREAIEWIASRFRQLGFTAATNVGLAPSYRLVLGPCVYEPHVTVLQRGRPVTLVQVETEESLGSGVPERWREVVRSGLPVFLFVPRERFEEAYRLRNALQVSAEVVEYPPSGETWAPHQVREGA